MRSIGSQEALILLRASFGTPRVTHLLRCSPSRDHSGLQDFDCLLRAAVSHITNSDLTEKQWVRASLLVRDGGLGIRRVSALAVSTFLSSAASTSTLQADILSNCPDTQSSSDSILAEYLEAWSTQFGPPCDPLPIKQSSWDRHVVDTEREKRWRMAVLIRGSDIPLWQPWRLIRETGSTPYPFPRVG